jgi:hypothetical protein
MEWLVFVIGCDFTMRGGVAQSVQWLSTWCMGLGIESQWERDFLHLSRPALGLTQPPCNGYQVIPGLKWLGRRVNHTLLSGTEIKERVELYLYFLYAFMAGYKGKFTFDVTIMWDVNQQTASIFVTVWENITHKYHSTDVLLCWVVACKNCIRHVL